MDLNLFKSKIRKENILTINGIDYNNSNIIGGVNYNQTVNSGTDIVLGSCTCATIEFELINLNQLINNLAGKEITWKIRVEGYPDLPMGIFIAEKPTKVNDTRIKVKAYDRMIKFDKIVDDWLRTVSYPITLKNFLLGLCSYVGVTLSNTAFLNDNYPVKFNFLGTNVKGREVLKWIAEIAGKYAIINELGQLKLGWYNSIVYSVNNSNYYNVKVEDYTVKKIDKLQVQVEENDIGVIVGTGSNAYVIQNNPLLYAATDAEIRPYIELIYNAVKDFTYIPFEIKVNANPLIKAGNSFQVTTRKGQVFNAVVMTRKMTNGNDVYSATGNASRAVNKSLNQSIQQLRGKTNVLERTIEQTVSKLYDEDTGDLTVLTQTVNSFNSRVQTIEANMNFRYQQDTPPENPEVGDVWLNTNPDGFIIDLLTMTVDEMTQQVDYYGQTLNKTYRWNGTVWEHIEDGSITELRQNVSEISQTVDNISLTVSAYDGRIGSLEVTANGLTAKVSDTEDNIGSLQLTALEFDVKISDAEDNIGELQLTALDFALRIENAELEIENLDVFVTNINTDISNISGRIDNIDLDIRGLKLATSASKLEFNSSGLTIYNGGFKIMQGTTRLLDASGGNLYVRGEFRTGKVTVDANGLWITWGTYFDGTPAGGRLYADSSNRMVLQALGWSVLIRTTSLQYLLNGNTNHQFTGNVLMHNALNVTGLLTVTGSLTLSSSSSILTLYRYVDFTFLSSNIRMQPRLLSAVGQSNYVLASG